MSESDHTDDRRQAVQEAAEHADRAGEERQEMRRTASLAEATDDSRRADELAREAEAHKSEAYVEEDASAERAP
jgi:hypothetical protein